MSIKKLDFSAAEKIIKAFQYSAQQCQATLSAWVTHCCCAAVPLDDLDGITIRIPKVPTSPSIDITLDAIQQADNKSFRKTISCRDCYIDIWLLQASNCNMTLSAWIVNCCLQYVSQDVRELISGCIPECEDCTGRLGYRLFRLYHEMDHKDSRRCLLTEFEGFNTHAFSHLPDQPEELTQEMDQMVDRMLQLTNRDDRYLLGDTETDTKLRFYFVACKKKSVLNEAEQEAVKATFAQLRGFAAALNRGRKRSSSPEPQRKRVEYKSYFLLIHNEHLTTSLKLERLRASKILHKMKMRALAGASTEQLMAEFGKEDWFNQYVFRQLRNSSDSPYELLHRLWAFNYCMDFDFRLVDETMWAETYGDR